MLSLRLLSWAKSTRNLHSNSYNYCSPLKLNNAEYNSELYGAACEMSRCQVNITQYDAAILFVHRKKTHCSETHTSFGILEVHKCRQLLFNVLHQMHSSRSDFFDIEWWLLIFTLPFDGMHELWTMKSYWNGQCFGHIFPIQTMYVQTVRIQRHSYRLLHSLNITITCCRHFHQSAFVCFQPLYLVFFL